MRKELTAFERELGVFFAGLKVVEEKDIALCACSSGGLVCLLCKFPGKKDNGRRGLLERNL